MPDLYVRNVPEHLYERVRERAEKQNRSLSAEVIALLSEVLEVSAMEQAELLASAT